MSIEPDATFRMPGHVIMREIAGEAVLLDLEKGMYYGLNEVGVEIWKLVEEGRTPAETVDALTGEFEVDAETLMSDLVALLSDLVEAGLVQAR